MPSDESALVVLVPEAEAVAKPFRERFDPSAAAGVPAHITLLYPFVAPDEIDAATSARLRDCFARFEPIAFSLAAIRRFGGEWLYLVPEPDEPFRQITLSIWHLFSQTPPYGGKWSDIVPHLSLARASDEARLAAIEDDLAAAASGKLPIRAFASEVALIESRSGRWRVRTMFALGR